MTVDTIYIGLTRQQWEWLLHTVERETEDWGVTDGALTVGGIHPLSAEQVARQWLTENGLDYGEGMLVARPGRKWWVPDQGGEE